MAKNRPAGPPHIRQLLLRLIYVLRVSDWEGDGAWTFPSRPKWGRIKGQTIYSLTGPWLREGAYQRSNQILLGGALAPRRSVSKSKPYAP